MTRRAWGKSFAVVMLSIIFVGCAAQTESKAIEQANRAAREAGYDLRRYKPDARYNLRGDGTWTVFYEPRDLAPLGDDFMVRVNRAGTATLTPGR